MKLQNPITYYKDLRPHNLTSKKYRHLFLLLFWPVFGAVFFSLEKLVPVVYKAITGSELVYHEVVWWLDAYIPLCEWFVIPYYFWFALLIGMVAWGLLFDIRAFRHYMWFIILSYSVTVIIYAVWPNAQGLRPETFPRDNWMIDIIKGLYSFDTNTNVCPSIHVLGSFAAGLAGLHSKVLRGWGWKLFFVLNIVLISISTVFMRQHSILDVFAALVLCAICYPLVYRVICNPKKEQALYGQES